MDKPAIEVTAAPQTIGVLTPAHLKDWVAFVRSGEFQKSEQVKITEETPPTKP